MNYEKISLYFSVMQLVFSLILFGTYPLNNNQNALYHTMAIATFMLLTALMGIYFSLNIQYGRIVATAWLIISIVTAYLSIQVSPYMDSSAKPIELALATIITLVWIANLYFARKNGINILKI